MSIYDIYRPSYAVELEEKIAALRDKNEWRVQTIYVSK